VIKSWKHKGLQKLFEKGDISGVQAKDAERIRLRLLVIDEAISTDEFKNYPGFRFHP
jgi:proteic killer suppression protein